MRKLTMTIGTILFVTLLVAQERINLLDAPARPLLHSAVKTENQLTIPFEERGGLIYVPGKVDGRELTFLFDTGAPTLVINTKPATQKDSDFVAYSCHQEVNIGATEIDRFEWAGQVIEAVEALTLDMTHFKEGQAKLGGLIGHELYADKVVVIDYDQERISLVTSQHLAQTLHLADRVHSYPIQFNEHLPVISFQVGEETLSLGIDTGASANLIDKDALSSSTSDGLISMDELLVQGLDQEVQKVPVVALDHPISDSEELRFALMDLSHLQLGEQQLDGILGYEFLSRYLVAIDYPGQRLLLWERASL